MGKQMLVREPSRNLTDGIVTYTTRVPVDFARARRQWADYVDVVTDAGWQTVVVPPVSQCPDGVFIEDPVFVYKDVAVVTRPTMPSRRSEVAGIEESLAPLGYQVETIEAPGTLEGGDILSVGDDVYVGLGGRSNAEGIGQLRAILQSRGATVTAVAMGPALHLKSALTALPDGSFIGYEPALVDPGRFPAFHPVPELQGSNVVLLGGNKVLMAANCRRSAALVAGIGFEVVPVDISEFQKREGDVTCLSVRLPEPALCVAADATYHQPDTLTA
ncbi:MAG TPA: arginine deiminase family protein [Acidimicrobiales bacterium]|nr:arginine deiminase family protein [Acidimicrobiales bacterium]